MTLRFDQLSFAYHRSPPALRSVSFDAPAGAFVAVVGPNGAGKSTLLRLGAGLLRPGAGHALIGDAPAHRLAAADRAARLAYIAQRPTVSGGYTVREVVALGRFALPRDDQATDRALRALRLDDRPNAVFNHLSAGQQQRAAMARALAQLDPAGEGDLSGRLLIADEPASSLDPVHSALALSILHALTRRGATVLSSLHDLSAALRWADLAAVLGPDGSLVHAGPAEQALHPDHLRRAFGAEFAIGEVAGARIIASL